MLVRPEVEAATEGPRLVFTITIEHADLSGIPAFVDRQVTSMVNKQLEENRDLVWAFADTLSHVFKLPEGLWSRSTTSSCA